MTREITKIGLAVMDGERVLLVKKRGSDFLILPGGKPEKNETDAQTLSRNSTRSWDAASSLIN